MKTILSALVAGLLLQQSPARVGSLLDQIDALVREVRQEISSARVTSSAELTAALAKGGRVLVSPGIYTGNFIISQPTELRGDQGAELKPADPLLPTLHVKASTVLVKGLTIHNGAPDREAVIVGNIAGKTIEEQPDAVVIEGNRIVAGPSGGHRGLALHTRSVIVRRNRIENFFERGRESQGIWGNNGPGPYLIEDNFIEASGENIMFGGDRTMPNLNPANITIRRNTLFKPAAWRADKTITVKNSLELKIGLDVVIEDNLIDGSWVSGQIGTPIVFTPRNQYGDNPWAQVDRVVFRRNRIKNCRDGYAINIMGTSDLEPTQPMRELLIEDNLFEDTPLGLLVQKAGSLSLTVRRNSFLGITRHFITADGPPLPRFDYIENVTKAGLYAMRRDDASIGIPSWLASRVDGAFIGNVIEQPAEYNIKFPEGNRTVAAGGLAALLDANLRLRDGSAGVR